MDNQALHQQSKNDRSRTKWTSSLDKLFVHLVVEQVQLGNRPNNIFNKMAWKHIRDEFNKQTGLDFDRKQLKKHLDVLRNRYDNAKSQFDQSEFTGMEPRHMFITGGEPWEDYIEDYPLGEATKIKDFPIYDQLCKIFSESGSIGRYAQSSHYIEMDKEEAAAEAPHLYPKATTQSVDPLIPTRVQDDSCSPSQLDGNLDVAYKYKPVTHSGPLKRKRSDKNFDDAIVEAMLEMATASKLRVNALVACSDRFSITKCVQVLDEISDVDERLYYAALDLFDNPDLREIFLSLKTDKRLIWLQGKCIRQMY